MFLCAQDPSIFSVSLFFNPTSSPIIHLTTNHSEQTAMAISVPADAVDADRDYYILVQKVRMRVTVRCTGSGVK